MDAAAFLRATPPFDALPRPLLDEACALAEPCSWPAGTWLARAGGEPLHHLHVVRRGAVRLERHGQTIQLVEEGETFGFASLVTGAATLDVVVEDDAEGVRIPAEACRRLFADPAFARHFAAGLGERLRGSLDRSPVAAFQPDLSAPVGDLVRKAAVWVGPGATALEAARTMRAHRISSVLVEGDPPGIVTDRDLRNRIVAEGLDGSVPAAAIASRPLRTVAAGTPVYQAWMELLDAGHHHLAVVRDGAVRGVVTSTDLMRSAATGPMALLRRVERLASRDALPGYAARVAEMSSSLLAARLDPAVIAQLVARLNDALVRTLARWAEADLGDAPAAWAWLAFGSEGRMEQTLLTDQDNALVFADAGAARRDWFQAFAERVNADLEAAGFPPCPGGTMARAWNAPLSEWSERLAAWSTDPGPRALLEAAVLLDFRRVAGHLDLGPLEERMAAAGAQPVFLRSMAEQALRYHPPPGLLLRVRGGASTVDLKLHGLAPIVFLARCYALELGLRPRGTLERLEELERAGRLDPDLRATLSEAFRFLLGLRMRLQLRSVAEGRPVGDAVPLGDLGPVERSRLKESFRAIREWQEQAAYHHRL